MNGSNPRDQLDILLQIEKVTSELNKQMSTRSAPVVKRYPLTFAILALFGVVLVSEGVKGILNEWGLLEINPAYVLIIGLIILTILGSVYRKLDK